MKLIKPNFEIYEQGPGLEGIYEAIERAGRTCYKSKRPEGQTAKDFVDRMIASQHYAMLEHGTVYLKVPNNTVDEGFQFGTNWSTLCLNPYTRYISDGDYYYYTTNYRVIIEHDLQGVLEYLCEPTEFHEKRVTVRFTTDIGVSREFNRHRVDSIAEQSTRYCNYSKDKFGNELSIVLPSEVDLDSALFYIEDVGFYELADRASRDEIIGVVEAWLFANMACEYSYIKLIELGWKPQQARRVLPLDLSTELVHTAFVSDFQHFFDLRARGTTGASHPDAKALAEPLMQEFIKRNLIAK